MRPRHPHPLAQQTGGVLIFAIGILLLSSLAVLVSMQTSLKHERMTASLQQQSQARFHAETALRDFLRCIESTAPSANAQQASAFQQCLNSPIHPLAMITALACPQGYPVNARCVSSSATALDGSPALVSVYTELLLTDPQSTACSAVLTDPPLPIPDLAQLPESTRQELATAIFADIAVTEVVTALVDSNINAGVGEQGLDASVFLNTDISALGLIQLGVCLNLDLGVNLPRTLGSLFAAPANPQETELDLQSLTNLLPNLLGDLTNVVAGDESLLCLGVDSNDLIGAVLSPVTALLQPVVNTLSALVALGCDAPTQDGRPIVLTWVERANLSMVATP